MSSGIQLIVGLGNPGREYEQTRHNAGAWFILALSHRACSTLRQEKKYHGMHSQIELHGHPCHLLIPTTYMNLSGQSVKALADYYQIEPSSILIAHDEIDLPAGEIRLKWDGGHGGHNGLRDIIRHLGTNQFHRLRIGVGHPGVSKEVVDYVLNSPPKSEKQLIDSALINAESVLPLLLEGQIQKAMHQLHTKPAS